MRKLIRSLLILISALPALANIGATAVWEVETTGNDTNGGCYVTGGGGTDYSQQIGSQFNGTDLVVDATTNTKVTSATHNFVAADVGNCIQITAGASWTVGFYQIMSVAANAATLDSSPAATSTTGGTWQEGGALATIGKANTTIASHGAIVPGNTVYVKATAVYPTAVSIILTNGTSGVPIIWQGYTAARGDNGKATIQSTNNAANPILTVGQYNVVRNFIIDAFDGTTHHSGRVLSCPNLGSRAVNIHALNSAGADIVVYVADRTMLENVYVNNNTGVTNAIVYLSAGSVHRAVMAISNTGSVPAIRIVGNLVCDHCISASNAQDGFACDAGTFCGIINSVSYANGRNGIQLTNTNSGSRIENNIIVSNTTAGISSAAATGDVGADYNFLFNTTNYNANVPAGLHDIIGTVVPFTNAAGGDYSLNNTAGGGAAARAVANPVVFTGLASTTAAADLGAVQHADPACGGGGIKTCASAQ